MVKSTQQSLDEEIHTALNLIDSDIDSIEDTNVSNDVHIPQPDNQHQPMLGESTAHIPFSAQNHPHQSLYAQYTPHYTPIPTQQAMAQSHVYQAQLPTLNAAHQASAWPENFMNRAEIDRGFVQKLDKLVSLVEKLTERVEVLEKRPSESESEYIGL